MARKVEDLTGRQFGYLKVLGRGQDKITPSGQKRKFWICECQLCGNKKEIAGSDLKSENTKSCGCLAATKGKAARNVKVCVVCGKKFECPPSDKKVTCSTACRSKYAQKRRLGKNMPEEIRRKISDASQGRDMAELQKIGSAAAKESPKSGRFVTNANAIDWHLISPEGKQYRFHSLNHWLRENCRELFGCEPDSREFINAASGLRGAKRAMLGKVSKDQRPCCTYKGWRVIPTEDDNKDL